MKQSLPWNITGIPSEAREAARAAASREGVTVGDWLTRRILAEQNLLAAVEARTGPGDAGTDMVQRVVRGEPAADAGSKRTDEMLRTMARRLESLERIQTEAQLAIGGAASEFKTAAFAQADALRQLTERLERLERQSDSGATRDAVRGLHQGLSRLADQIAQTTAGMTSQIAALADSIARIGDDAGRLGPALESRQVSLEERIGCVERQIDAARPEQSLAQLEQRVLEGEERTRESIAAQFESVRRTVEAVSARLEQPESRAASESGEVRDGLAALTRRIEAAEAESREERQALRTMLAGLAKPDPPHAPQAEQVEIAVTEQQSFSPVEEELPLRAPAPLDEAVAEPSPATEPLPADTDLATEDVRPGQDRAVPDARGHALSRSRPIPAPPRLARRTAIAMLIAMAVAAGFLLTRTLIVLNRVATLPGPVPASEFQAASGSPLQAGPAPGAAPSAAPANDPADGAALERAKQMANAGDAKAALALGIAYADGQGVPRDDAAAAQWLRMAAQAGNAVAQYRLGALYEKGLGVSADVQQAAAWYAKAAAGGNRKAMHNLAVAYTNGAGVEKNYAEAVRWFTAAADLGLLDSQFNLAVLYERGLGVTPSLTDAYKWYAIAAAGGDAESQARAEALSAQLQPRAKAAADAAVRAFRTKPMNPAANDSPALTQIASQ